MSIKEARIMANKYRFNPATGTFERIVTKQEIIEEMIRKGRNFDEALLLWYGEKQAQLAR